MQDALPALVLGSQAIERSAMNGTPENSDSDPPAMPNSAIGPSDEQLMSAFAGGSKDAFGELFSRYKQPLYGFFRRRVTDPGQAEELTQETFFAVLRASSRYEPRALFRTYLYAIGFKILGRIAGNQRFGLHSWERRPRGASLPRQTAWTQKSGCARQWENSNAWIAKSCCCVNLSS